MSKIKAIDLSSVRTYPLASRHSKVKAAAVGKGIAAGSSVAEFLESLPHFLAANDLREVAREMATRHRQGRKIILGMGAHPIKVGLAPLIVELMEEGVISAVALNGAGIIHDYEMAADGATSEEVGEGLDEGLFGMARETGEFLNSAIVCGPGEGLGERVGHAIQSAGLAGRDRSILAAGDRLGVPVTVHVAIGTDIIHMHPSADGAAIGSASLHDFRLLAGVVAEAAGGIYLNLGSAVILPEVFLKALNLARNVGSDVDGLLTVDMDFLRHYRPRVNVVERPAQKAGRGIQLTGHHEVMFPLLCAAFREEMARGEGEA